MDEEDLMWSNDVLGSPSPKSISLFLDGKKTYTELHRAVSSASVSADEHIYVENGSKDHSSGLQDFKVPNKSVSSYASGSNYCHVYLATLAVPISKANCGCNS